MSTDNMSASQLPTIPDAILRMSSIGLMIDCTYCGLAVSLTICQSDKNSNARKPMARQVTDNFHPPPWMQPAPSSFLPPSNEKRLHRKDALEIDLKTSNKPGVQEIEEGCTAKHQKEIEREAKHHFVLNWFDTDDKPVDMQELVWPAHIHFNMKGKRSGVHAKLKHKCEHIIPSDLESNVEIVEGGSLTLTATRKQKWQRDGPLCNVSLAITILIAIMVPINATAIYVTSRIFFIAIITISIVTITAFSNIHQTIFQVVWPHSIYTVDMAAGFHQLDDPTLCGVLCQEELFQCIFEVPYVKATYYQNHWSWIEADLKICEAHEQEKYAAGCLWKHFLHAHRIAMGK
ncbi:hypothetical protein BDR05DRAFT_953322 [Suillus weaverae]|nr:hypothetical protein BDR05DRAFT_953322 [Suillus weaverae]